MRRPRLLVVGQGLRPTGYARGAESVLDSLSETFDATLFAVHSYGRAPRRPFEVRGNELMGDPYGREQLPALLDELEPDVVLVHHDPSFYAVHRPALDDYRLRRPGARVVVYCPVDWQAVPASIPRALSGVDRLVLYTRFGRRVITDALRDLGLRAPPTSVVPHGVDSARFRPLVPGDPAASRLLARRRLFSEGAGLEDAFVVLNANRNTRRQRVDLTLRGFAPFARDRPDARLYLHMGMLDCGFDVPRLAGELGIADRILTTPYEDRRPDVSDEHKNLVYNACDVGLNTSEAEGWGLVSFEHAAAGAAQVVPGHGASAELWPDDAVLVPAGAGDRGGHEVAPDDVAAALALLYDPSLRAAFADRAHRFATSPRFGWAEIARQWERLLLGCLRDEDYGAPSSAREAAAA